MNDTPVIYARGLQKSYGSLQALRGVDLEVRRGEVFGFLGPNGAGKTTTIRCLLDLIRPNGGELRVLGLDPQKNSITVRARTGYLPGELHIEDNLAVEGALRFFNRLRGNHVDWSYVRQLAEQIDLDLKMPVKNLSKGNKQKVGVIQALMHRPELLLLDEPTFGLDPLIQREVLALVVQASQAGATVFFSSHILSEVEAIAQRVAIIRKGVVIEVADTATLIRRALRRVRIHFQQSVDSQALLALPGVTLLAHEGAVALSLQVEGDMDGLIKALAAYPVQDFESERPSLEEIFLAYYERN
jgi:ABC-2 type transport system ATP-binding protein